jgi:hypothetical protein
MRRGFLACLTAAALLPGLAQGASAGAVFVGPGPGLTGNDTGGIIAYTPAVDHGVFRTMAADWCARWDRLSHVTSVHRRYGEYIAFVCIDRPGMIH